LRDAFPLPSKNRLLPGTLRSVLHDERGDKTTITLSKWVADVPQIVLPDVHAWVQDTYDRVAEQRPLLTRRAKGDLV
jgi:hypothetical protein